MKRTISTIAIAALIGGCSQEIGTDSVVLDEAAVSERIAKLDPGAGKDVASWCADCHGENGVSTSGRVPNLAAQHAAYLYTRLNAYKDGERKHPVMSKVVQSLGEPAMLKVAAWYASQPAPPVDQEAVLADAAAAAADPLAAGREAAEACAGCHGDTGNSEMSGTPRLAGQHSADLEAAIEAYRAAERGDETMQPFAEDLSEEEIRSIAMYYAAQKPQRSAEAQSLPGDPKAGERVAVACAGCHGADGNSPDPNTPTLAGQDPEYLIKATKAYADGTRHYVMMKYPVAYLSEADIANIAAYYASQEPKAPPVERALSSHEWAERCDRCHGKNGVSTDPRYPTIAGQSREYIAAALKAYHSEFRKDSAMQAMTALLDEEMIETLAAHYAAQERGAVAAN